MKKQFIQLGKEKPASISQGKRKLGRIIYTLLQKTQDVLSSGGDFSKYNYVFLNDTIKVFSLIHNMQEKLQFKDGRLRNFIIASHKFKNLPVYERVGNGLQSFSKECQDSLPEGEVYVAFGIFHDIVNILAMCGESKYGLSRYHIKFRHGRNFVDAMLDIIS